MKTPNYPRNFGKSYWLNMQIMLRIIFIAELFGPVTAMNWFVQRVQISTPREFPV